MTPIYILIGILFIIIGVLTYFVVHLHSRSYIKSSNLYGAHNQIGFDVFTELATIGNVPLHQEPHTNYVEDSDGGVTAIYKIVCGFYTLKGFSTLEGEEGITDFVDLHDNPDPDSFDSNVPTNLKVYMSVGTSNNYVEKEITASTIAGMDAVFHAKDLKFYEFTITYKASKFKEANLDHRLSLTTEVNPESKNPLLLLRSLDVHYVHKTGSAEDVAKNAAGDTTTTGPPT